MSLLRKTLFSADFSRSVLLDVLMLVKQQNCARTNAYSDEYSFKCDTAISNNRTDDNKLDAL
ncbi:hypothetical protein COEREDRAFT_95019 [Coemansia reversa NRRL 1564]|uniref:Uncharacterized protein n=1 Tax=Coemansia reversa (strain ATCC 12441 / NRRL 1564) TaxID=763665 RepID=A0A2G5B0H3_COERN|nr:hypothetical protein COEREDRAFT_95019 [Coemansia reversa NRRL 1564]|eukprot:PIA12525.1 hypothetical protein COEREDRAFT_95019 [Coemansia reversa NRRL 1564]